MSARVSLYDNAFIKSFSKTLNVEEGIPVRIWDLYRYNREDQVLYRRCIGEPLSISPIHPGSYLGVANFGFIWLL